ncbi:MAG: hypothetical protein WC178_00310 [Candidatus Paceibacterota bacterium]
MSILHKIDLKKLRDDKNVQILFLIWIFFCIATALVFYFQINALHHIDVPTHIGAGLVITAFIYATIKVKNGRQALALAFIPFILWEIIEITISHNVEPGFIYRLFNETNSNILQDISMDTLGFFVFMIMTGKRF